MQASKSKHGNGGQAPGVAALVVPTSALVSTMQNPADGVICQGWMLKKRRKKMQGYAKRYFILDSQGVLSYSMEPGTPIRDHIPLKLASITSSASDRSRAIHVDSAAATFHLKALGTTDYALWMSALRRFCTVATNPNSDEPAPTLRTGRGSVSLHRARSLTGTWMNAPATARALRTAHDMNTTIQDLEAVLADLSTTESGKKHKNKHKDKGENAHNKDIFGIFHRKSMHGLTPPLTPSNSSQTATMDTASTSQTSPPPSPNPTLATPYERLQTAIATLKAQHNALLNVLEGGFNQPGGLVNSPLMRVSEGVSPLTSSPRHSIGTLGSGDLSVWFDAEEGAEEFVLASEPTETRPYYADSHSDVESEGEAPGNASDDSADEVEGVLGSSAQTTPRKSSSDKLSKVIIRRTKLPAPMSGDDGSLLAVLRKNVGKDLSTVSFPVSFNEPISILQRLAEDLEYTDLLSQAVASSDPVERICLVAAFAVSGYACTLYRASRKPFNPMLGETFEDVRMRFLSEKVSHHPPVMACHAEGKGWEYWATSSADSKFWGRSLEIINKGTTNLKIGTSHYQWRKPSSFMRNLIVGEKYLAHEGEMTITDLSTGHRCNMTFKEGGYWGPSRGLSGTVYGPSDSAPLAKLDGTWHEGLSLLLDPKGSHLRVLWRAHSFPPHSHQYYGFTTFTMSLNEITSDIAEWLPPTDSRHRPDQKAMEEGRSEFADEEKARVEAEQRTRRKAREQQGDEWVPQWFERSQEDKEEWLYKGGYWESRAKKDWSMCEKLW